MRLVQIGLEKKILGWKTRIPEDFRAFERDDGLEA
jgi:hypothetical protein